MVINDNSKDPYADQRMARMSRMIDQNNRESKILSTKQVQKQLTMAEQL